MMELPKHPMPGDENARADVESGIYGKHYTFKETDVVYDIGAHVGFFMEWLMGTTPKVERVICFEPNPRNYYWLEQRRMEGCQSVKAAWITHSGVSAHFTPNPQNSGAGIVRSGADSCSDAIWVKAINMVWVIGEGFDFPDFVKIDAEGCEENIITDILNYCRPSAFAVEVHSDELGGACVALLQECGYKTILEGNMLYANR